MENLGSDGKVIGVAEATVASAATCDIGAAAYARVVISGTTGITSLGTVANRLRFVRFSGALTLTHNATSLILPSGENITTVAGDCAIFQSDASGNWRLVAYMRATADYATINFVIDGAGATITTGLKGFLQVDFAGTIVSATLLADQSGSIVVDVWKDSYANYPPVVGDKITASAPPTITTATKSTDSTLTGWTKDFVAGDVFAFNVNSVTTVQRVTVALKVRRK